MVSARDKLLDTLRTKLRAPIEKRADRILEAFGKDKKAVAAFQRARADLDALISRLEHEELGDLAGQLESHSAELRAGIKDLDAALKTVKDLARTAEIFSAVLGLVARIVALA